MKLLGISEDELKKVNGYYTSFEMNNQLTLWNEGVKIIGENRDKIQKFIKEIDEMDDIKIYLAGAGSSAKAASILCNYIKKITGKDVISVSSTTIVTHPDDYIYDDKPALLVSLGGSGNTIEGIETIEIFKRKKKKLYQILLICSEEGEIVKRNSKRKDVLYISAPKGTKGKSFAATGEFTVLIQYALMIFDIKNFNYYSGMFDNIIADGKKFLEEDIYKVHDIIKQDYSTFVALGSNSLLNLASEMCLKISELSAGTQSTEFHSILEFRHGPKLILNSKPLVTFFFTSNNHGIKYEIDMLKETYLDKRNGTIVGVSINYNEEIEKNCDFYFYFNKNKFNYIDDSHIIFQYSLLLQSIAILKSIQLKIEPDIPDKTGSVNKVAKGVIIYK